MGPLSPSALSPSDDTTCYGNQHHFQSVVEACRSVNSVFVLSLVVDIITSLRAVNVVPARLVCQLCSSGYGRHHICMNHGTEAIYRPYPILLVQVTLVGIEANFVASDYRER